MLLSIFATWTLSLLLSMFALVGGTPVARDAKDVFVPTVLYPRHDTVWYTKQRYNVTWYLARSLLLLVIYAL